MRTITKEFQHALTSTQGIELLQEGNRRFVNNLKLNRNLLQQVNETSEGQHPFAVILSCIDSRTSAELIFDLGLGDIFSIRIAGNILNEDILGSMEFACKVAGAKVIMVLGHTKCGAVKGACDHVEMGHLSILLKKLESAVSAETSVKENRNGSNIAFVNRVADQNIHLTMSQINRRSVILREMIEKGEIAIVGGMYDVESGVVKFYDQ